MFHTRVARKWAHCLHNPRPVRHPQHFTSEDEVTRGQQLGKLATQPLSTPASTTLQTNSQPTSGRIGYIIAAVLGAPKLQSRLHNHCGLGCPQHFMAKHKLSSGAQLGNFTTYAPTIRESRMLHNTGQNQQWPKTRRIGYVTLAAWGCAQHFTVGINSKLAHK